MSRDDYAQFLIITHTVLGIAFCLTILLAPLGILLIRRGRRLAREVREGKHDEEASDEVVDSIAMSWDDVTDV